MYNLIYKKKKLSSIWFLGYNIIKCDKNIIYFMKLYDVYIIIRLLMNNIFCYV